MAWVRHLLLLILFLVGLLSLLVASGPHVKGNPADYFTMGVLLLAMSISTFYFSRSHEKGWLTFLFGLLIFGVGMVGTFDWLSPVQYVSPLDTVASVIASILFVVVGTKTMGAAYKDNAVNVKDGRDFEPKSPGFFDKLADASFKQTDDGKTVYYPLGVLGKGRIIQTESQEFALRNFNKRTIKYLTPFCMLYGAVCGVSGFSQGDLIFIVCGLLLCLGRQLYLIHGLPVYDHRLTMNEAMSKGARIFHPAFIVFAIAVSVLLIITAFFLPFVFDKPFEDVALLFSLLVALALFNLIIYGYIYKIKKSSKTVM